MPDHPLRKILSGIIRGAAAESFEIAYVHRGAPEDCLRIRASEIALVRKGSFVLSDGETQIPFHRILHVKDDRTGLVIWQKRTRSRSEIHNP